MKRPYTAAAGSGLTSIGLFNSTRIRGITIDNPTSGWIFVVEIRDFCPPYTLQWTRDLEFAGNAITVTYGAGPSGQVNTITGDPYTVTLDSEPVGNSPGVGQQFIDKFTPVLNFADNDRLVHSATGGTGTITLVAASASLRYRLLTLTLSLGFGINTSASSSNVLCRLFSGANRVGTILLVPHATPVVSLVFPAGFDYPINTAIRYDALCNYADQLVNLAGTYQAI
jgi:hypothetical protein